MRSCYYNLHSNLPVCVNIKHLSFMQIDRQGNMRLLYINVHLEYILQQVTNTQK